MLKYINTQVVFQEFPGEVTMAINLSRCPHRCPGCHSPFLQEDAGTKLDVKELESLLSKYSDNSITCVGFMGGDNDLKTLRTLVSWIKANTGLKVGWYSGRSSWTKSIMEGFDYVKFGPYKEKYGPLSSPTTNQVLLRYIPALGEWLDITPYFRKDCGDAYRKIITGLDAFVRHQLYVVNTLFENGVMAIKNRATGLTGGYHFNEADMWRAVVLSLSNPDAWKWKFTSDQEEGFKIVENLVCTEAPKSITTKTIIKQP